MNYDTWSIEDLTLEQLADRQQRLQRMQVVTQDRIKGLVVQAYANGETISNLAKKAGVSRVTIYAWLNDPALV